MLAQIRESAIKEFSIHGFRGASTQAIAERAGISKPHLHYYINGKEELYAELLHSVLYGWSVAFEFDEQTNDPAPVLASYLRRKLDYALDNPALSRIFTMELLGGGPNLGEYWPIALESTFSKTRVIDRWVARGLIRKVDSRMLMMHMWAMTQHYADYAVQARVILGLEPQAPFDREPIAQELVTFVLLGLGLAPP